MIDEVFLKLLKEAPDSTRITPTYLRAILFKHEADLS